MFYEKHKTYFIEYYTVPIQHFALNKIRSIMKLKKQNQKNDSLINFNTDKTNCNIGSAASLNYNFLDNTLI
jgi:hypothetical protein